MNNGKASTSRRILIALAGIALLVVAWELATAALRSKNELGNMLYPSLEHVLTTAWKDFALYARGSSDDGAGVALQVLGENLLVTLVRVVVGVGAGVAIGIVVGMAMAESRPAMLFGYIPVNMLRAVAGPAVIPLFSLWFGGRELGFYTLIAYLSFAVVVAGAIQAARHVPRVYGEFARTLGAGRTKITRSVGWPAMLPELFASVRIVVAMSWSFALGAEYIAAQDGLGLLMIRAGQAGFLDRVMVVLLIVVALSILSDALLLFIRNRVLRWMP